MGDRDLLGSLFGGGQNDENGNQDAGGDLGDLLGGLTGNQQPQQSAGGGLGDLLGGLLGGGQTSGGLGGLLGGLLGGSASAGLTQSLATPLATALAEKLGLPQETALMIVSFAIAKILPAILGKMQGGEAARSAGLSDSGLDLDDLVQRVGSGQPLGHDYLASSGLAHELAQQAEIDDRTAEKGLEEAFGLLGSRLGAGGDGELDLSDLLGGLGQ